MTAPTRLVHLAGDHRPASFSPDLARQVRTFVVVGFVSTAAYAVLFTILRAFTSAGMANVLALVITAIGNTAANRRLTFGVRGRASLVRDHLAGLTAFAVALVITSCAIAVLGALAPHAERWVELGALSGANAVATLVRFLLLRTWVRRDPLPVSAATYPEGSRS